MVRLKPSEASESLTEGLTHQPSSYQKSSAVVRSVWADQPALLQQLICKLLVETGKVSPAVESVAATDTSECRRLVKSCNYVRKLLQPSEHPPTYKQETTPRRGSRVLLHLLTPLNLLTSSAEGLEEPEEE
ncbi:hypothetical protein ILYODFUR_034094 [Ilyodon furcidens]|uniref:Uncharacterized protein n=1 Tax=Ilyodon furcidens TaxID=33524 RepID=A0ABV0TDP8_9TELE